MNYATDKSLAYEKGRSVIDPITRRLLEKAKEESLGKMRGPILLMYHGTTPGKEQPSSDYSISAEKFSKQLDLLQELGWHTVRVCDLLNAGNMLPKTVVLTFDDGYKNNYRGAFIPLRERGMCATWFVVSGAVGGHAHWLGAQTEETAILTGEQLKEMIENGMEIGAHTRLHSDLTTLPRAELEKEISESREELESLLADNVHSFAYPYGRFNKLVVNAVRKAGFNFACSIRSGWFGSEKDPLLLRRVTVFANDSLSTFARKLVFADNDVSWGRLTNYAFERLKTRLPGKGGSYAR